MTRPRLLNSFDLTYLKQISAIQFTDVKLKGRFDKPFDPNLFIPTHELDQLFSEFLDQDSYPVFLILANVGMGKIWNSAHLGISTQNSSAAIHFFIPIYQVELLNKIDNAVQIREKTMGINYLTELK
ncbi:MAG: hypothetical protein ACTSRZ_09930 [Promethearchaeota archaeon]